ncbi:hypothetical protein [Mesorhizobium sp. YR577]|uniref:hypothetical protein n=2 Tax=Mesorhizobium TaxID=68287 RepID=UPI0008DEE082|nr:hypothetical protein [Mesorhizobium sp. YR577]SFU17660.1 hypothetical protein SAMN05518861_11840 [Mesorhizobium sp. YR577]
MRVGFGMFTREDPMQGLQLQDVFQPYYADRRSFLADGAMAPAPKTERKDSDETGDKKPATPEPNSKKA